MKPRALGRSGWLVALGLALAAPMEGQDARAQADAAPAAGESQSAAKAANSQPAATTPALTSLPPVPTLPDVEPGTRVPFDLDGGRIAALPFDIQFDLVTEVEEGVTRVSGRYVGDADPLLCEDAFPRARLDVDYGFGRRPLAPIERRRIQRIGSWAADPGKNGKQFAVLNVVDGLLPNRYYCFEFTRTRKPEMSLESFRRALADRVDRALRLQAPSIDGPDADAGQEQDRPDNRQQAYRDLRQAVIAAVEGQMGPGERLIVPPDSFLNRSANKLTLPAASRRRFDAVLQAQGTRANAIAGFQLNSTEAVATVLGRLLATSPGGGTKAGDDLVALHAVAKAASPSAELQAVLRGKEAALVWAELALLFPSLLPPERERIVGDVAAGVVDVTAAVASATGRPVPAESATARPWDEAWSKDDLEARRQNLRRTLATLDTLKFLVAELRDQKLVPKPGVVSDLSVLRSAVADAIGEIEFLSGDVEAVEAALADRDRRIALLVGDLGQEIVELLLLEGSTQMAYDTGGSWYLGGDFGLAWAEDLEDLFTYVGANIYLRPVNKRARLRWSDFRRGQFTSELLKRLSVTLGMTLNELKPDTDPRFQGVGLEDEVVGLIADRPLVFGAGLRLSRFVRLTAGALLFKDENPDPLIDSSELAWAPMISVSVDWNFRGSLRKQLAPAAQESN